MPKQSAAEANGGWSETTSKRRYHVECGHSHIRPLYSHVKKKDPAASVEETVW